MRIYSLLALMCIFGAILADGVHAAKYNIIELGTLPGGGQSCANSISDNGLVVGSVSVGGWSRAFLYDGTMHDLGTLASGRPHSSACGVNDSGQVVGYSNTHPGEYLQNHAFFYDGTMQDLGELLSGTESCAVGINNKGQIAITGYYRAFLYYDGVMHDLGTFDGAYNSRVTGINERGDVIGSSWTIDGYDRAFLYDGTMHDLGALRNGGYSHAQAINDHGQVVGYAKMEYLDIKGNPAYYDTAFIYDGTMRDLGTLNGNYNNTYAWSINNIGQVVGWATVGSGYRPFLYDNGVMHDLNDLIEPSSGWILEVAYDINNSGQIVGYGNKGAFLLTPVPEPSALFVLCAAMAALGCLLRRR